MRLANAVDVETRELWRLGAQSQVIYLRLQLQAEITGQLAACKALGMSQVRLG